ncbi:helix-turn-helix domain-containing protein [Flagellimonas sp.]|uniref:helix-turn-helix domain-containing protein n=1 Tax=Flagellimonas sp. TaxID=2058762 RepID=UPI003B502FFD
MHYDENELKQEESNFKKRLGEKIKDYRLKLGWSQHKLGLHSNISRTQISRLENGEISTSVITLLRIAKALKLDKSQLLDLLD